MSGRNLLKFADLKTRQIAENHPHLKDLIDKYGFPPGFWTGPNSRRWWEDEVEAWLVARPTEHPQAARRREISARGGRATAAKRRSRHVRGRARR